MSLSKLVLAIAITVPLVCVGARFQDGNTDTKKKTSHRKTATTATQQTPRHLPPPPPPPPEPLSFKCGQSFYVAGSGQLGSTLSLPDRLSYVRILIPPCDGVDKPDFVLHLREGAFVLEAVPAPTPAGGRQKDPPPGSTFPSFPPFAIFAFALALVSAWLLLAYLLWILFLRSQVKSIAESAALTLVKNSQPRQTSFDRSSANFSELARDISSKTLSSFKNDAFQPLAERVLQLERERSAPQPKPAAGTVTRIMEPLIVEAKRETSLEKFIRLFNAAKRRPSSHGEFASAYRTKALQLTNTTEVAKSATAKPLFDWQDDGDLLAVRAKEILNGEPSDHYYLVPRYDKRWGTDRYTGGRWDYFFQINVDRGGSTELIAPAIVKFDGISWELAGEQCRGEISVDTNAS